MDEKIYVGVSYYPEHWPKERWGIDIAMMREAGITTLRLAELAWSFLEPEDGRFDFTWLDEFISMAYKEGLEVILGTPIEATPTWLNNKHPEIVATDETGHIHGGRGLHCYNTSVFNKYVERLVDKMASHYASNPAVIGWQIDNELRAAKCYCPTCAELFRNWLKEEYGTLDKLNEEWGTKFWSQIYNSWDEIMLPGMDQLTVSVSQKLDHSRFASESCIEYVKRQIKIIKSYAPHQFVSHNALGLYPWLDVNKLGECLDFSSWDSYPNVDEDNFWTCFTHDLYRGTKRENFWVLEQKNGYFNYSDYNLAIEPGLVRQWAYQDIARGANGVMFYRWRANRFSVEQNPNGLLLHDGRPRRAYYEVKKLNEELKSFSRELSGTKVDAPVAILHSYDQIWAYESHKQYRNFDYRRELMSYYRALTGMGITCDLADPMTDLSSYKVVIAPCLMMVSHKIQKNLEKYVENGGYLITTARSGIKTWTNATIDTPWPGLLSDLAGVVVDEFEVLPDKYSNNIVYKGREYRVKVWLDMLETKTAESLAVYTEKFYAGRTAIARNKYKKGTVLYVGVMGNDELSKDLLIDVFKECNISVSPLPEGVFKTTRVDSENSYTFFINMGNKPARVFVDTPGVELISNKWTAGEACINAMDTMVIKASRAEK